MNGIPEPSMQPLHPDKPEPAIVKGDIWVKIATGKTSVNAPTCQILGYEPSAGRGAGPCRSSRWAWWRDANLAELLDDRKAILGKWGAPTMRQSPRFWGER